MEAETENKTKPEAGSDVPMLSISLLLAATITLGVLALLAARPAQTDLSSRQAIERLTNLHAKQQARLAGKTGRLPIDAAMRAVVQRAKGGLGTDILKQETSKGAR